MAKRQISEAAQAAKMIRKHLRDNGIKNVTARSSQFSMGNSVNVTIKDDGIFPATREKIERYCSKFQYGHFDGMIDLYESSNHRDDIPQSKFVSVDFKYSDELKQECWNFMRGYASRFEDMPENYKDAENQWDKDGNLVASEVYRELRGSYNNYGFWTTKKPRQRLAA